MGHGAALVDCEGGEGGLLVLKVHIRHAVDGQKRCDMLGVLVDSHGAFEEHAADHTEFCEHIADLWLCDIIGQAADV